MSLNLLLQIAADFSRERIDAALHQYVTHPELCRVAAIRGTFADLGRENVPTFLAELDATVALPLDVLRPLVSEAWKLATVPELLLESERWVQMFRAVGYAVEGVAAIRPAGPLRLWRGAPAEHRYGMSWTDDLRLADHFAREVAAYFSGGVPGQVWTAVVQPSQLLAFSSEFTWNGAHATEREYVVDTSALEVTEWTGGTGHPSRVDDGPGIYGGHL